MAGYYSPFTGPFSPFPLPTNVIVEEPGVDDSVNIGTSSKRYKQSYVVDMVATTAEITTVTAPTVNATTISASTVTAGTMSTTTMSLNGTDLQTTLDGKLPSPLSSHISDTNTVLYNSTTATTTAGNVPVYTSNPGYQVVDSGVPNLQLARSTAGGTSGNLASWSASGLPPTLNDSGVVTTSVVIGPASATSGNIASYNGTGGKTLQDSGIASNVILTSSITTPDVAANLIFFRQIMSFSVLSGGQSVTLVPSGGAKQYRIISLTWPVGGANFSGGDRLGQVTDGTTVWTVVPAASMQTRVNTIWGGTAIPLPATSAVDTGSVAGQPIVFKYSGGTTDYTAGQGIISGLCLRIA